MPLRVIPLSLVALSLVTMAGCEAATTSRADRSGSMSAMADHGPFHKPGYLTEVVDGRLWVFAADSEDYAEFKRVGEPAKHVTRIGDGPRGMTIKAPDTETIIEYLAAKPGYLTEMADGVLWVLAEGSAALVEYQTSGEPAKNATLIGVGPLGASIRSDDKTTIVSYLGAKPGYVAEDHDGVLWVFADGSEALAEYRASGEPAKNATLIGVGPMGRSVRSGDTATIKAWMVAAPGYTTLIDDGRLWVFEPGSPELAEYHAVGEPAKHVTRIGVGPMGMTVKAPSGTLIDGYLADLD
jgi:hypothetical protein